MNTKDHHQYCTDGFSPDDIVISGMSGRFPHCLNVGELYDALVSGKNLLEPNNDRYEKGAYDLPFSSSGTLQNLEKFDAEFFGITFASAHVTDPLQRMLLEVSYEAMVDSGYDPTTELKGCRIGVYSAITNEDGKEISFESTPKPNYAAGYLRCMCANRCSHTFDFHGPSYTIDSACSSSLVALWSAYLDLKEGRTDAALVNAGQLCLSPIVTKFYINTGIVSTNAESYPFDARAAGIVRTEAITALFLQKASSARRAYATVLDIQHVSNGRVPEGVYVPSLKGEIKLFKEVMQSCGLTTHDIQYIEAHGTGTPVGDPIEVKSLEETYCEGRKTPLYIGSIKGDLGHTEASAGHCGTIKALLAFEKGIIPPCSWFKSPNPNCEALVKGTIKVLTEPVALTTPYIPVNSFGFGGSILQTILKRNPIEYPCDEERGILPRLVLFPATTEASILSMFEYIEEHPELRNEFFALLNKLSFTPTLMKPYRGYALFQNDHPLIDVKNLISQKKRDVWFVMTGMGCQWPGMGLDMMRFDIFAESMQRSAAVLKSVGMDLFEILRKDGKHLDTDRSITPAFVAIAAIQIALVDMLRALDIHPDGILGHSVGELLCAYADGCCTAEQAILLAYWRGKCVESSNLAHGAMAAVGLTWEEASKKCPKGVYPACHNSEDSVTISGPKELVEKFVAELQEENVFARVVNAYGYAFHSEYVWPASKSLRNVLLKTIPVPRPRSDRWITTSYPEEEWQNEDCKMAGAEYFVHNLMSVVNFNNMLKKIPSDAITIEIGPHFLLQSILKRSLGSDASYIGLMKRNNGNNAEFFLQSMGKLYVEGLNPKIENLYPPVRFPVPRSTPFIAELIKWDHSQSWEVPKWQPKSGSYEHKFFIDGADSYLLDHFIDGKSLFPATGYVFLAWQALAKKLQKKPEEINVVIEDFKIHRATIISPKTVSFNVAILDASGTFEILDSSSLVASGKIYDVRNMKFSEPSPVITNELSTPVSGEEMYSEMKVHGYEYGPAFRKLIEIDLNGTSGFVEWRDWITFMDSMLIFYIVTAKRSGFFLPTGALSFKICPSSLRTSVEECQSKKLPGLPVKFYPDSLICRSPGIEIKRLFVDQANRSTKEDTCMLEEYRFVPYIHKYAPQAEQQKLEEYMIACNKMVEMMECRLKVDFSRGKFNIRQKEDFDINVCLENVSSEQNLLLTLKQIVDTIGKNNAVQNMQEISSSYLQKLGKDYMNNFLINEYCLRIMFDIIMENNAKKVSVLEINDNSKPILPEVVEIIENVSMLKFKNKILVCKNDEEIDEQVISDCNIQLYSYDKLKTVAANKSQGVVISAFCAREKKQAEEYIHLLASTVNEGGFILLAYKSSLLPPEVLIASLSNQSFNTVSPAVIEEIFRTEDLLIVSKISDNAGGILYLLRHRPPTSSKIAIKMEENEKWLDDLKHTISESFEVAWIVSVNYPSAGIIGMVNCLRHEIGGDRIRCIFVPDRQNCSYPTFSLADPFFSDVLEKDLTINVYKDGTWGSFRHIKIEKEAEKAEVDYSYVDIDKCGDLSSIQWYESFVNYCDKQDDDNLVQVYYSALNFKDVMIASGKLSTGAVAGDGKSVLGFEVSGRKKNGKRVAGICPRSGIATATRIYPLYQLDIPDSWSMEEAATVPVVYLTSYYALIVRGQLKPGQSVLIHSGTGGVGQAAINIALSMNCVIFTTVGTEQKRQYLQKKFPQIKQENIGCSRDTSFEDMILKQTKGRGVDLVLNSLAEDKFYASIRCVAKHGSFLEIGKYDLSLDKPIGSKCLLDNISIHGVQVDFLLSENTEANKNTGTEMRRLLQEGIKSGVVKPLDRTVFQINEVEEAFRYMGTGTHTGKVLIKIRAEEKGKTAIPKLLRHPAVPVTYFYPHKVYIVIGGLGGFGIELSKWLLSKGAKNLILTTRYGARTPYHHLCLKRWKDGGYNVIVSTKNVSVREEAQALLKEASHIGPVGGIFNSAVVLHDAFLENVSKESFKEVCAPKADATEHLDILTRRLCTELDHFVCFSSISCGRGNAGQMNYGYANSVMERICEQRRAQGLPGVAIQWGIIGEVGVVHRHMGDDAMIAGVGAQKVQSCLKMLDLACQLRRPVVCSYVLKSSSRKRGDLGDPLQQLAKIFGLKDASEFNPARSFSEMGIDSMVGVEIKHLLETTCDVTFTVKEIQELKIDDVKMLIEKVESQKMNDSHTGSLVSTSNVKLPKDCVHNQAIEPVNDVKEGSPVFIIDLECSDIIQLHALAKVINQPAFAVLWSKETPTSNVESLASWYLKKIKETTSKNFHIIALSSSSILAFEMELQSQKTGKNILSLTILEGSFYLVKAASKEEDKRISESDIICDFVENYIPGARQKLNNQLIKAVSFEQRVRSVVDLFTKLSTESVNKSELSGIVTSYVRKMQQLEDYTIQGKISKDLTLIENAMQLLANDVAEVKSALSEICSGKITIHRVPEINNFSEDGLQKIKIILNSVL